MFEKELSKDKRLHWVEEECECLSRVRPVQNDQNPLYLNFKGAGRLDSRSLAVLEALLQYRKKIAAQKDKPLFKVFRNQALLLLAIEKPTNKRGLQNAKALSHKQVGMYGNPLMETISWALKLPEKQLPIYPRKKAHVPNPAVPKKLKALKKWRDAKARALEIEPTILFTRALLSTIADENPQDIHSLGKITEIKKWQKNEFGSEIVSLLKRVN
jgi:ribonuclease D